VHVDATPEQIRTFHSSVGDSGYDAAALEELPSRYERPNDRNRWERPLFVLQPEDDDAAAAPLLADVLAAVDGLELKPNMATVQQPVAGPTRCRPRRHARRACPVRRGGPAAPWRANKPVPIVKRRLA
jgi:hypothetical protein